MLKEKRDLIRRIQLCNKQILRFAKQVRGERNLASLTTKLNIQDCTRLRTAQIFAQLPCEYSRYIKPLKFWLNLRTYYSTLLTNLL